MRSHALCVRHPALHRTAHASPHCIAPNRYVSTEAAPASPDDEERLLQRGVAGYDQPTLLANVTELPWAPGLTEVVVFFGEPDRIKPLGDALQPSPDDLTAEYLSKTARLPLFIPSKGRTTRSGPKHQLPNRTGLNHANQIMSEHGATVRALSSCTRGCPATACGRRPRVERLLALCLPRSACSASRLAMQLARV